MSYEIVRRINIEALAPSEASPALVNRLAFETLLPSEVSAALVKRLNLEVLSPFSDETIKRRPKFFTYLIE